MKHTKMRTSVEIKTRLIALHSIALSKTADELVKELCRHEIKTLEWVLSDED